MVLRSIMLEIKKLTKAYGKTEVYSGFDLSVEEGKITCILGESGSGKTTLLNCIAGLTGYIGQITPVKCSYVFQTPRLVPNLTAEQNLSLVCRDKARVCAMLGDVGLGEKRGAYPKSLSGGQAQRVSLARAFLYESDALLMDEPFSSLDLRLKNEMHSLFLQINSRYKRTVLFVTHDVDEAVKLADRLLVLNGGKIVFDCSPKAAERAADGFCEGLRKRLISVLTEG